MFIVRKQLIDVRSVVMDAGLACSTASPADRGGSRFRLLTIGRSHLETGGHPLALPPVNHTAAEIRAVLDGHTVVDTTSALYVWRHRPPLRPTGR
jgi:hypothetical protein